MIQYKHPIVQKDLRNLVEASLDWQVLSGKTLLVAGATGMLASYTAFLALYLNEHFSLNLRLILLARNLHKLQQVYGDHLKHADVRVQDVCDNMIIGEPVNYILHAAGASSPRAIIDDPVGIIRTNTLGTMKMLEQAKMGSAAKLVFLSTREVYGKVEHRRTIRESDTGFLDPLDDRSCYPESKRMAETLLRAYATQHGIPFNTLRISHSYGPGMQIYQDGRVLADCMQAAVQKQDIQLKSLGLAIRAFCYITDTVEAIYRVMISGLPNEAYNVANETEPVSVLDLARTMQAVAGHGKGVQTVIEPETSRGYTNYDRIPLDTSKLRQLGWVPKVTLRDGLERTLRSFSRA